MPKPSTLPTQPKLRALTQFECLFPEHKTFLVTQDGAEPHLNVGEYAVIDTNDRELQNGELYLIQWSGGARLREIVHVRARRENVRASGWANSRSTLVWYVGDLRGFRAVGEASNGGSKVFTGVSDGPYFTDHLQEKLIGRIVGFASSSLGGLLARELGFVDERAGNDAFDPGEYIDVLMAAGYRPVVSRGGYYEHMPKAVTTPEQNAAVTAMRHKWAEASTAFPRVTQECIRRGLIDATTGGRRHG